MSFQGKVLLGLKPVVAEQDHSHDAVIAARMLLWGRSRNRDLSCNEWCLAVHRAVFISSERCRY